MAAVSLSVLLLMTPRALHRLAFHGEEYSSGVGRLVELQVSGEDLALRLALRSVDAGRGSGRC